MLEKYDISITKDVSVMSVTDFRSFHITTYKQLLVMLALYFGVLVLGYAYDDRPKEISLRIDKDYALFFAVSNYNDPDLIDLEQPIKDTKRLATLLEEDYSFQTEVVENPTFREISSKLHEYKSAFEYGLLPSDGQLLIYFSGHGMVEDDNGYFLASDSDSKQLITTALAYNLWRSFINSINCQHILVAVDACYSNRFEENWDNRGDPRFRRPGLLTLSKT